MTINNPTPLTISVHPASQFAEDVEFIISGFSRHWFDRHRIVMFTLHDMARQTIDVATETVLNAMITWPKENTYLAVYNFLAPSVVLSPYMQNHMERLRMACPELTGYVAVVVRTGIIAQIMQLAVRQMYAENRLMRLFTDEASALAWLRAHNPSA